MKLLSQHSKMEQLEKKVPGEGTYTIDENGKVTFTPEKTFTGQATGVTVKRVDKNWHTNHS